MKNLRTPILAFAFAGALALAGCASAADRASRADLSAYPTADMSCYESFEGYDRESAFVKVSALEAVELADSGEGAVIFCAFDGCPWCEAMVGTLNDAALDAGWQIAYVDTRKDPSWENNADMDGYAEFMARFGEWMDEDESGEPHLYVPDLLFVREGEVVAHHQGVVPSYQEPGEPLTAEQAAELRELLDGYFELMR